MAGTPKGRRYGAGVDAERVVTLHRQGVATADIATRMGMSRRAIAQAIHNWKEASQNGSVQAPQKAA